MVLLITLIKALNLNRTALGRAKIAEGLLSDTKKEQIL